MIDCSRPTASTRRCRPRLGGKGNPNMFLLNYDLASLTVTNPVIIPKHFVTIDVIEKKKPLGPAARP